MHKRFLASNAQAIPPVVSSGTVKKQIQKYKYGSEINNLERRRTLLKMNVPNL